MDMSFFISNALAEGPAGAAGAPPDGGLSKGDEVITNGGVLARINEVGDSFITIEIADGVEVQVQRNAIASLVPKGTYKAKD